MDIHKISINPLSGKDLEAAFDSYLALKEIEVSQLELIKHDPSQSPINQCRRMDALYGSPSKCGVDHSAITNTVCDSVVEKIKASTDLVQSKFNVKSDPLPIMAYYAAANLTATEIFWLAVWRHKENTHLPKKYGFYLMHDSIYRESKVLCKSKLFSTSIV